MATEARRLEKKATPWGPAVVVDRLTLQQRAGDKRFATILELLETEKATTSCASHTRPTEPRAAAR